MENTPPAIVVPVEVIPRHIHLSLRHYRTLFGLEVAEDNVWRTLSQRGQFASGCMVDVVGPAGVLKAVRVLGPCRQYTQVELSPTDATSIGLVPPMRLSGAIVRSLGCVLRGPAGEVRLKRGVIVPLSHVHMSDRDARRVGMVQGQRVLVSLAHVKPFSPFLASVRVHPTFRLALHLTTDQAAETWMGTGDLAQIFISEAPSPARSK